MASTSTEHGGVPKADFIDDVDAFMKGKDADKALAKLQEDMRNYKTVEQDLMRKRVSQVQKLPELSRAVEIVKELIVKQSAGEDMVTDFLIAEGVYAKGRIKNPKTVNLWLGANVMLEYPLDEALELLETNQKNLKTNLKTNEENLAFIKDCVTTMEVSISRVYNWDVERRRKLKEAGEDA